MSFSYELLLFVHVVGAIVWVGGLTMAHILATNLVKTRDVDGLRSFCTGLEKFAGPVFGGSGMLTLIGGVGVVAHDGGYAFSDTFVSIGFVGLFLGIIIGAVFENRSWTTALTVLRGDGTTFDDAASAIAKAQMVQRLDLLVLYAAVAVMVFKPGM